MTSNKMAFNVWEVNRNSLVLILLLGELVQFGLDGGVTSCKRYA